MNQGQFVSPTLEHIQYIAENMREADRQEVFAMRGEDADLHYVLANAVKRSTWCVCGLAADGTPVSLVGVAPVSLIGGVGAPWLLGTDRVREFSGALIRYGRDYIQSMTSQYPQLINYVDARNTASIRWLKRLGFTIHDAEPIGHQGLPFHKFTMG